ncbi:MAG: hypothetical protein JNN08_14880, partial [Bryobacterales bacterium]|nr:hypothetical protein [Bryobacterales bacterium]
MSKRLAFAGVLMGLFCSLAGAYELREHPRILVGPARTLAARATGPLRGTYEEIKAIADRGVAGGIPKRRNAFETPLELLSAGICHMVERAEGRDGKRYADAVKAFWGDGAILARDADGPFGYDAMV